VLAGRVENVLADAARPALLVGLDDLAAGTSVLRAAGLLVESGERLLSVAIPASHAAHVTRLLADAGLYVSELRPDAVSLEDLFLDLTEREERNEEVAA
jgi:hypothetical protein